MDQENRGQEAVGNGDRECALFFMALLFVSTILIFPYYMQPEPSATLALLFSLIPMSILFYALYLVVFAW